MNDVPIRLLGNGGFARELASYLRETGPNNYMPTLYDSREAETGDYWTPTLIAVGDPALRAKITAEFEDAFWTVYSWREWDDSCQLSEGVIVCPGTIITVNVTLLRHVLLNLNCTVGHDTLIGPYSVVSPGANISGHVSIGAGCYIGTGAALREGVTLASDVTVGAGAVVVKDIVEAGTYVGVPARRIA